MGPQHEAVLVHVEGPAHLELQRVKALLGSTKASYEFAAPIGLIKLHIERSGRLSA
jgi:hypothetical protein